MKVNSYLFIDLWAISTAHRIVSTLNQAFKAQQQLFLPLWPHRFQAPGLSLYLSTHSTTAYPHSSRIQAVVCPPLCYLHLAKCLRNQALNTEHVSNKKMKEEREGDLQVFVFVFPEPTSGN